MISLGHWKKFRYVVPLRRLLSLFDLCLHFAKNWLTAQYLSWCTFCWFLTFMFWHLKFLWFKWISDTLSDSIVNKENVKYLFLLLKLSLKPRIHVAFHFACNYLTNCMWHAKNIFCHLHCATNVLFLLLFSSMLIECMEI